jgi:O-antigen ligase
VYSAILAFILVSWGLYLFKPSIGVFLEPITNGQMLARMAGPAHPNTLGQFSAIAIVITCLVFFPTRIRLGNKRLWLALLLIAVSAFALYFSLSRSSMIACAITLGFVFWRELFRPTIVKASLIVAGAAVALVLFAIVMIGSDRLFGDHLAERLSKSGDPTELTSLTGRSIIWTEAIRQLSDRPLLGFGLTSSKSLLKEFTFYTHNATLNVAFSAGVITAFFFVVLCLYQIRLMFYRPNRWADAIMMFVLLNGLTENVIFENFASAPTALFALCVIWRHVESPTSASPRTASSRHEPNH